MGLLILLCRYRKLLAFTSNVMTILNTSALLVYAIGCYPCIAAASTGDSRGQVITVENGIVLVDVTVNQRGPFRMIVDTGAASCILRPAAARYAGLAFDHRTILAALGGETVVPAASNNVIQVGSRSESNVAVLTTELPQLRALHSKADGVLGQSFLSRTPYLIDYREKRLWFGAAATKRAKHLPVAVAAAGTSGRIVLPVVLEPGGRTWRLTLDSGASDIIVECREHCPNTRSKPSSERLITYAGEQTVLTSTFRGVRVGGVALPPMNALIVSLPSPDDQDEGVLPTRLFSAVYVDSQFVKLACGP